MIDKICKECGQRIPPKPVIIKPTGKYKKLHKHRFGEETIGDSIQGDCKIGLKLCLDCGYTEHRKIPKEAKKKNE